MQRGVRARQRGQAIVEFGLVALIFTLLMFAIVDLGLLLNTWVRVSSATREVGRAATVGYMATAADDPSHNLNDMLHALVLPGVSSTPYAPFTGYCCVAGNEIVLHIDYYPGCFPGTCAAVSPINVDQHYWGGTCPSGCTHPVRGDLIVVSIAAPGMEVLTPLVRPFFGCPGTSLHCNVRLGSTATMRYEGPQP